MTREEFYNSYLEDPLLVEKNHITLEQVQNLSLADTTNVKILEVFKLAINGILEKDSESTIIRNINKIF